MLICKEEVSCEVIIIVRLYAAAVMLTVQEDEVEGGFILKLNSRILESSELRKLDKSEKGLLNATLISQKGMLYNDWLIQDPIVYTT